MHLEYTKEITYYFQINYARLHSTKYTMKVLDIIARGGSKGIPGKNIRILLETCLYTIEAGLKVS